VCRAWRELSNEPLVESFDGVCAKLWALKLAETLGSGIRIFQSIFERCNSVYGAAGCAIG
jgi:hypothetical protein